ncbi:LysR family transcriptional regulator [Steroidobacter sp.]|uniref:LysR family transcriptional regulator n=1 Tax=Steroidobacter sp. TaxID=1978227 RepID=UPI0032C229E4
MTAHRRPAWRRSAITKHLQNLERHMGARLFERSARAVRPTGRGLRSLRRAT